MANNTGNKYGGRGLGTPNKITAELRKRINVFLSDNWDNMQKDFNQLEPKDRFIFYEKLLQYGLPRLQSTNLTSSYDFEQMTEDELSSIIHKIENLD